MSSFFLLSILCFLFALFGLIVRLNPKRWRRVYQHVFEEGRKKDINRNKFIDEAIPAPIFRISIFCLVLAVTFALIGMGTRNYAEVEPEALLEESTDEVAEQIIEDALRSAE